MARVARCRRSLPTSPRTAPAKLGRAARASSTRRGAAVSVVALISPPRGQLEKDLVQALCPLGDAVGVGAALGQEAHEVTAASGRRGGDERLVLNARAGPPVRGSYALQRSGRV